MTALDTDQAVFYLTVAILVFMGFVVLYFTLAEKAIDIEIWLWECWQDYCKRSERRKAERATRKTVPLIMVALGNNTPDYVAPTEGDDTSVPENRPEPLPNAQEPTTEPAGTAPPEPAGTEAEPEMITLTTDEFIAELARVIRPDKSGIMRPLTYDEIASISFRRKADIGEIVRNVRRVEKREQPEPYQFEQTGPSSFARIDIKK